MSNMRVDEIAKSDEDHAKMMFRGSLYLLRAIRRAKGENIPYDRGEVAFNVIGDANQKTWTPTYHKYDGDRRYDNVPAILAEKERVEALRVTRETCYRCGARDEYNCGCPQ